MAREAERQWCGCSSCSLHGCGHGHAETHLPHPARPAAQARLGVDRPGGVFINDPKGLFVLRWYKEVDGSGKPLTGRRYQNKGCKAYELCAFNDGDRFCWTPQAHLVSKVYLKKHPTLPFFCYTINAKDKKMVNDFVKARSS